MTSPPSPPPRKGSAREVFGAFFRLGLTSFGGPVAHLGYFREELVTRRGWVSERDYADLVALCQFLPGPASSQLGFALGYARAGWPGALAAFLAFTAPSALLLILLALTTAHLQHPLASGALHGLKLVAVAIVAQAVWGMAATLCPDRARAGLAVAAVAILALLPGPAGMATAILAGACAGLWLCPGQTGPAPAALISLRPAVGVVAALLFVVLMIGLPLLASLSPQLSALAGFYRAGALVFGGGHVVLPLLEGAFVQTGLVSPHDFLAGYGATQAVPGPLFTFAAWLGALMGGVPGALLALIAIFLPGFLLLIAALPFYAALRARPAAQAAMQGANAAVVGVLGAALYSPVFTQSVTDLRDLTLALACFVALMAWKAAPWKVVAASVAGGILLQALG